METLNSIKSLHITAARFPTLGQGYELKILRAAKEIAQKYSAIVERTLPQNDLETLERRFNNARNNNFTGIKKKDWRKLPWLFWMSQESVINDQKIYDGYLNYLTTTNSSTAIKTLIYVYLREYPRSKNNSRQLDAVIKGALAHSKSARLQYWNKNQEKYNLFDGVKAETSLANEIINKDRVAKDLFEEIGLVGELARLGLSVTVFYRVLKKLQEIDPNNIKLRHIERITEWAVLDGELRHPESRIELIHTLLNPWQELDPEPELQEHILLFLREHFGDPRVRAGKWQGIDDSARNVIQKWLVKETLEDFFAILDNTARDSHWRYRRAFWLAYYEIGAIDAAWIALGPNAEFFAKQKFGKRLLAASLDGSSPDQSVLLIKISNLIFAEWSHNGSCHAWYVNDYHAPQLNQTTYLGYRLRKHSNQIVAHYSRPGLPHQGSERGHWQGYLELYIRKQTGIGISYQQYMRGVK